MGAGAAGTEESSDTAKIRTSRATATARTPSKRATATADKAAAARIASLQNIVFKALDDMKALEVKILDVRGLTDVADTMVIASGTSDRI